MKTVVFAIVVSAISCALLLPVNEAQAKQPPRLILQITVDALRADLPHRYAHVLGDGGFRRLWSEGIEYTNAHYQHANTETIVGHVSLATGTVPAAHGMVGNVWYDRERGRLVYNIEDARYRLLTAGADVDQNAEIDPTQKAAKVEGRSPAVILSSTFSDELAIHFNGNSKIFAVSVKDRGAVSMAGHAGKAFWFSKTSGEFVTSTYYYKQYPDWVNVWNARKPALAYAGKSWQLLHPQAKYLFGNADDREYETDFPGFGRTFPHDYGPADGKYFTTLLTLSPAGDEITLDFAEALIDAEAIGQDEVTDYLAISFSSTDYVGHFFGPSSLESEDNIKRLDRTLAELLAVVDEKVGLDRTLIVLSADHGAAEVPGFLATLGIEASHFNFDDVDKRPAIEALKARFGVADDLVDTFSQPYVYLDDAVLAAHELDKAEVEAFVAEELRRMPGIAHAISSSALRSGQVASTSVSEAVLANFHAERSGDIYVVFEPHWFVADLDGVSVAAAHGSPWAYDTYVPVIVVGPGITPQRIARRVETVDVAPTIAAYLGIKPPTGSLGEPLVEVLR